MTLQAHHIACVRGGRTLFSSIDLAVGPGDALWVTGANAYDPKVASALGLEAPSRLVGFLALGTPKPGPILARPSREAHVREWRG